MDADQKRQAQDEMELVKSSHAGAPVAVRLRRHFVNPVRYARPRAFRKHQEYLSGACRAQMMMHEKFQLPLRNSTMSRTILGARGAVIRAAGQGQDAAGQGGGQWHQIWRASLHPLMYT